MQKNQFKKTILMAILLALATVLSLVKVFSMPMGGSITLLSMLPIVLFSNMYGIKWGFSISFLYAVIQLALDIGSLMSWGLTPTIFIGALVFDYVLAYGVLGISGVLKSKGLKGTIIGTAIAFVLRFLCHVISGVVFFGLWVWEGWSPLVYSVCYNGAFMLPELVFTLIATYILFKSKVIKKLISKTA